MSEAAMPKDKTVEQVGQLARDVLANRVFTSIDVPEQDWRMVFMPAFLGDALTRYTPEQLRLIVLVAVEGRHPTMEMSVNGYPVFAQVELWLWGDFMAALKLAKGIEDAGKALQAQLAASREAP